MRKLLLTLSSTLLMTAAVQAAPQLVPIIPVSGASSTSVFGIADDNNTITGSYVGEDGFTHGFYGTLDGNYTSFDFPGATSTQARAIDASGTLITGFSNIELDHCEFIEWEYDVSAGKIKQIRDKHNKKLNGAAQGIAANGAFAGDYCSNGIIRGQIAKNFRFKKNVNAGVDSSYTGERGLNRAGDVVGFYVDEGTGLQVGTIINGHDVTVLTYPDANESYTVFEGVNDHHDSTGQWGDTGGIVHSFLYNTKKAKFTELDDPSAASFTQAWGVNNSGLVAVSSDAGAYIYCPSSKNCPSSGLRAIVLHPSTLAARSVPSHNPAAVKLPLPKGASRQ